MGLSDSDDETLSLSPFLSNLHRRGRLAPSRLRELLKAAKGRKEPPEPAPGECCGSSCKPCVLELWRQEMRCWRECHPDGEEEEDPAAEEVKGDVEQSMREVDERRASPKVDIELDMTTLSLEERKSN